MPYGYHGKILHVFLSDHRLEVEEPPAELLPRLHGRQRDGDDLSSKAHPSRS